MPGVLAVLTGAQLAADKIGNLICGWMIHSKDGSPMKMAPHPAIAKDKACFVGDPVAVEGAQGVADNSARFAETIERRSVEIANTGRPRRLYKRLSFFSSDRNPVSPEGSGAEPQDRQSEGRAPQMTRLEALHTPSPLL